MDETRKELTQLYQTAEKIVGAVIFDARFRRLVSLAVYVVLPLALVALWASPLALFFARQMGELAQALLLLLLFMKPAAVIFNIRILRRALVYRRQMGVVVFYLALFHFALLVNPARLLDFSYYTVGNHVLYGAPALLILALLGITSNDRALKLLRRNWLRLHKLAYLALVLVIIHSALANGELFKIILIIPLYAALKILEYRGTRITLPVVSAQNI